MPPTSSSSPSSAADVLIVGIGNRFRGDDGAGLEVLARLTAAASADGLALRALEGEAIALLELWEGARAVVLVDAVSSGAAPGTIHRIEVSDAPFPARLRSSSSTHAVGLAETIELARALERLPERLVVYGLEGERFEAGTELSGEVAAAVDALATRVLDEARELAGGA